MSVAAVIVNNVASHVVHNCVIGLASRLCSIQQVHSAVKAQTTLGTHESAAVALSAQDLERLGKYQGSVCSIIAELEWSALFAIGSHLYSRLSMSLILGCSSHGSPQDSLASTSAALRRYMGVLTAPAHSITPTCASRWYDDIIT